MKTIILQGDGFARLPREELGGQTPLEQASTPGLDSLARKGELGCLTIPGESLPLTGDALHLSLLGYHPKKFQTGPGAFAGVGLEVVLGAQDVAYLCSLVTLRPPDSRSEKKMGAYVLVDDVAGGIETEEARDLIDAINEQLGSESIQFYTGSHHHHLMVWVNGATKVTCSDPHLAVGKETRAFFPSGERADILTELMDAARYILGTHPVNREREEQGFPLANGLWVWGPGKAIQLPSMTKRFGIAGMIVAESDQHRGIGMCSGLTPLNPEQDNGSGDVVYTGLMDIVRAHLGSQDVMYVHVEEEPGVPDFETKNPVRTLELFDQHLVSPLLKELPAFGAYQLLVACNYWRTTEASDTASSPPYAYYSSEAKAESRPGMVFHEIEARKSGVVKDPTRMLDRLLGPQ